jgi:hypothetical protein
LGRAGRRNRLEEMHEDPHLGRVREGKEEELHEGRCQEGGAAGGCTSGGRWPQLLHYHFSESVNRKYIERQTT